MINDNDNLRYFSTLSRLTRPTLERRATKGHLRFIKPNMINHFGN